MTMTDETEALEDVLSRLRSGASRADAELELLASGFSREDAFAIVSTAIEQVQTERTGQRQGDGNLKMFAGATLLVFGIGTMIYTFIAAPGTVLLPLVP